jgi:hypothetical protein
MMWRDLDGAAWPQNGLLGHSLLNRLIGEESEFHDPGPLGGEDESIDHRIDISKAIHVVMPIALKQWWSKRRCVDAISSSRGLPGLVNHKPSQISSLRQCTVANRSSSSPRKQRHYRLFTTGSPAPGCTSFAWRCTAAKQTNARYLNPLRERFTSPRRHPRAQRVETG